MTGEPRNGVRWWWTAAVAAVVLGGLGVMARKGRSTSTELEQLRAEIATLRDRAPAERTVIVREVPGALGAPPATATPPIPAPPDAPGTREEQERRAKAVQQAMEHLYGETYLREPADPQWAQAAARTIRDRYTGKDFQGLEVSVECKKTICRMDFTFPEGDQALTATHKLVETDPWPCQRYTRVEGEDHVGFMFISRQGSNLPALDPKTVTF